MEASDGERIRAMKNRRAGTGKYTKAELKQRQLQQARDRYKRVKEKRDSIF